MMKLKSVFTFAAVSGLLLASCADSYEGAPKKTEGSQQTTQVVPVAVTKSNTMQVYAHYMPWFETTTSNPKNEGKWGYHWTMKNCEAICLLPLASVLFGSQFFIVQW